MSGFEREATGILVFRLLFRMKLVLVSLCTALNLLFRALLTEKEAFSVHNLSVDKILDRNSLGRG